LADANFGHGQNDDKKKFAVQFLLTMAHIPPEIKLGCFDFDVASQIVNIADDAIQVVFDKLNQKASV